MWLKVGNLYTLLSRSTPDEKTWLREYLAFDDEKLKYMRGRFSHNENKVRMFNLLTSAFPTGFLAMVKKAAAAEGFTVEVLDARIKPTQPNPNADLSWLRDYQRAAVDAVLTHDRGIIWATTGSGKTECAVALARALPTRWLFVVHRTQLVHQAADRYELRTGGKAGRIGEGLWDEGDGRFICATFQTLYRTLREPRTQAFLENAGGLIVDEVHTLPSETFQKVAMQTKFAYWRVGLSGTPLARGDRRSLLAVAATGPVIYRIRAKTLIDAGVLAKPHIRLVPVSQMSDRPTWQGVYGEAIVRSGVRNRCVVEATTGADKPCLVFVKEIKHGQILAAQMSKAGMHAEFVWGKDDVSGRNAAIKRLVRGDIDTLITSVIMQEGVDVPALRSVVVASGGKSIIATLQRIGRGMRRASGKDEFDVYDFKDSGCGSCAGGHRGCRWLEKHTRARMRAYASEQHEVTILAK